MCRGCTAAALGNVTVNSTPPGAQVYLDSQPVGRTPLTVPQALEVKEELEKIDELLRQLEQARETAQIAVQASLTGHLVLATIHTNDAASSITRLVDMGIEPFLLSSSLLGVLGQRLVRKLCTRCRQPDPTTNGFRAVGCDYCGSTGYLGRTGIYELLTVDDEMRMLVHQGANDTDVRRVAEKTGMINMRTDAQRWIKAGVTSQEEALRVTREG